MTMLPNFCQICLRRQLKISKYLMLLEIVTEPASEKSQFEVITNTIFVHKPEVSKIISLIVLRIDVCQILYRLTF
jgi:hypothetical protein